jgi:hypothetical protein
MEKRQTQNQKHSAENNPPPSHNMNGETHENQYQSVRIPRRQP